MSVDANISRTITLCRFPLIAVVVMLHSGAVYSVVLGGVILHISFLRYLQGLRFPFSSVYLATCYLIISRLELILRRLRKD